MHFGPISQRPGIVAPARPRSTECEVLPDSPLHRTCLTLLGGAARSRGASPRNDVKDGRSRDRSPPPWSDDGQEGRL